MICGFMQHDQYEQMEGATSKETVGKYMLSELETKFTLFLLT
jgi:hypothetical protein